MNRPKVSYIFEERDPERLKKLLNIQRLRNYRFLNKLPSQIFDVDSRRILKNTRYLKKLEATSSTLISNRLLHVLKNIKTLKLVDTAGVEKHNKNTSYLLARCKNINQLVANNRTESLLTEGSYDWLRALTKLDQIAINYPNDKEDVKKVESLLNKRNFENVHLIFRSAGTEKGWKCLSLTEIKNLSVCIKHGRDQGLPLFSPETLSRVKTLDFIVVDGSYPTQEMIEYLQNLLKNTENIRSLGVQKCKLSLNDFITTITDNVKKLTKFEYYGDIYGPKLENFSCNMFSRDHLRTLKLLITDQDLDSYLIGKFLRQIKQLVNLEDLDLRFACTPYADQIVHDLPCNLQNLKKVTLKFGYNGVSIKGDIELRLHLNTFLDWIVSLPNLEEIYLAHPSINYCYCSHLEDYQVSRKLRVVEIIETEDIYDLSLLEVEYLEHDLTTILKILSTENLERFIFPIHLESFKQHMVDIVIQNMMKCVKLKEVRLIWWFNLIGPKIVKKIASLFCSLYFVKEREFIVEYCKMTGGQDHDGSGLHSRDSRLEFRQFENCSQVKETTKNYDIYDLLTPSEKMNLYCK